MEPNVGSCTRPKTPRATATNPTMIGTSSALATGPGTGVGAPGLGGRVAHGADRPRRRPDGEGSRRGNEQLRARDECGERTGLGSKTGPFPALAAGARRVPQLLRLSSFSLRPSAFRPSAGGGRATYAHPRVRGAARRRRLPRPGPRAGPAAGPTDLGAGGLLGDARAVPVLRAGWRDPRPHRSGHSRRAGLGDRPLDRTAVDRPRRLAGARDADEGARAVHDLRLRGSTRDVVLGAGVGFAGLILATVVASAIEHLKGSPLQSSVGQLADDLGNASPWPVVLLALLAGIGARLRGDGLPRPALRVSEKRRWAPPRRSS